MSDALRPDPGDAASGSQLIEAMRQLKAWSGVSYRTMQARARAAGDVLPASTAADMVRPGRSTLPRVELVAAFARACGCTPEQVAAWTGARRRIAMQESAEETPADRVSADTPVLPPTGPAGARGERFRRVLRPWLAVLAVLGVLMMAAGAASPVEAPGSTGKRSTGRPEARPSVVPLRPGPVQIHAASSNLCLSEKRGSDKGLIYLASCTGAFPPYAVRSADRVTYTITSIHPQLGPGCMGVDPGDGLVDSYCDDPKLPWQRFWLEPVAGPYRGYRLHIFGRHGCIRTAGPTGLVGTRLVLGQCSDAEQAEVFTFEPRP